MATSGDRASPMEMLFTAASMIGAVNSILGGVGLALLAGKSTSLGSGGAVAVGVVAAAILFGLHLLYGYRRAAPMAGWAPLAMRRRSHPPLEAPGGRRDSTVA
jgi:hypothetical protein